MEGYGMSESSGIVVLNRENINLSAVGKAVPGNEIKIHNPNENGEGEVGRGNNVSNNLKASIHI